VAPPTALEAGLAMIEALHGGLAVPGSYFWMRTRGTVDPKPGQSGVQIDLLGQHEWLDMLHFLHRDRLFYVLSAHAMAQSTGRDGTGYLVSLADLAELTPRWVAHFRAGLHGREAFRRRPIQADVCAKAIIEALGSAAPPYELETTHGFPVGWPCARVVRRWLEDVEHYVQLRETPHGLELHAWHYTKRYTTQSELSRDLLQIVAACREQAARLSWHKLQPNREYLVTRDFASVPVGERITYLRSSPDPRNDYRRYVFRTSRGEHLVVDGPAPALEPLSEYLQAIGP